MKKTIALVLCLAMTVSLLAGCGSSGTSSNSSGNSGTSSDGSTAVTIGYVGGHYACYPSSANSDDFVQQGMVYDKLFEVDDTTGEYTSRILSSYEWTDDQTLVMTLKDGITFSDGNQMTMEDVLFSIHNYIDQGESTDKYQYFQYIDFDATTISDDKMTLTLVYQFPYGPAERTLNVSIMEKAFTEEHDTADQIWYTGPVGSGPYTITDCVQDSYVTFTLRDDYWNTDYSYDATEITLRFYSDETAMYMDYQAGNLDALYGIGTTVASQIEAAGESQGTVQYISNNDVSFVILNEENQYLSDPAVREAIAYALDMDYITEVAYGTLGEAAKSHFASTFDCYTEHEGYTTDIDKAKQLLSDAGYSDGQITLRWLSPDSAPQPQVGEAIQAQLSQIGINVTVESYDLPTALSMYMDGEGDIMMMTVNGGNPTREPYQSLSAFASGAPFSCMSIEDATYNEYLNTGMNSVDTDVRWEAYENADQWLYDNYNALPICETLSAVAYNSRIASFDQSAVGKGCLGSLKLA
jgi:peptide/nickel transport system substrate-binding protein